MVFRNFISHTHNLTNQKLSYGNSTCRITIVQRKGNRSFQNLDTWVEAVKANDLLGPREIRVVDFADYSLREQIQIANSADILFAVHGAALVHMTWLPPGAAVVFVNPYMFPHTGLINLMRDNLMDLQLGEQLILINYTEGHYVEGQPLTENCVCYNIDCALDLFFRWSGINIDVLMFSHELLQAVKKWRLQQFDKPLSKIDSYEREGELWAFFQKEVDERIAKGLPQRPSCV